MHCKLCGKDKKLVRAHIIPKSLWKPLFDDEQTPQAHSAAPTFNEKKTPVGVYDTGILCAHCESIFSPWDDYAQKILLSKPIEEQYVIKNGRKIAYIETAIDYAKLKLFFISLLWKAAVSNHYFFSRVNVGPFEPQLRRMILKGDPGGPDTFAVVISKCENRLGSIVLNPQAERWGEINYYRFYVAGYMVYIKADRRPAPDYMSELALSPEKPLFVSSSRASSIWASSSLRTPSSSRCSSLAFSRICSRYCDSSGVIRPVRYVRGIPCSRIRCTAVKKSFHWLRSTASLAIPLGVIL